MTLSPEELGERRALNIALALDITNATLRNGLRAADLDDILIGVHTICQHHSVDPPIIRLAEVAFQLKYGNNIRQLRLGAALGAALIIDSKTESVISSLHNDKPAPWRLKPAEWSKFLTFLLTRAEDFLDLQDENFGRSTAGIFYENVEINRRKPEDIFYNLTAQE